MAQAPSPASRWRWYSSVDVRCVSEPAMPGMSTTGGPLPARPLLWHLPHYCNQGSRPAGAIRDGDWKLIEHYEDGRLELFNLARDAGERQDLSAQEPKKTAELHDKLAAWRRTVGAQVNQPNPAFDAALHKRLYVDVDVSTLKPAATAAEMRPRLEAWREQMQAVVGKAARPDAKKP